ncbi:MAG: VWA domain-containing protein [Thermodesulfobacteriota bacterium]|jgi:uncharacterized protein YegL
MKEEVKVTKRPGGELSSRPLYCILILDVSESMANDGKIQSLNYAIHEAIPAMKEEAAKNCEAQMLILVITFSTGAQWHISQPVRVEDFKWEDVSAGGVTDMGKALKMVADQLKTPPMPERAIPPVLVLISDGQPTDDFGSGLKALMEQRWGKKSVRVAIAMGHDANLDVLQKFIGHPEIKPLQANNPGALAGYIKWATTAVITSTINPPSQPNGPDPKIDPIVPPLPPDDPAPNDDVW